MALWLKSMPPSPVPVTVPDGVVTERFMLTCAVRSAIALLTESMTAASALLPPERTTAPPAAAAKTTRAAAPATSRRRGRRTGAGSEPPTKVSLGAEPKGAPGAGVGDGWPAGTPGTGGGAQ